MSILAYLDAGSGSLILQAILGGLAGVAVAFKAWKSRFVGRKAIKEAEAGADDTPASTES